jgi:hypothetical protein
MANNFGDNVRVQRTGTAEWKVYDNGVLVGTHTKRVTAHAQATGLSATGSHSQRYPGTAKAEVQVITMTSFAGTDSFTVTVNEGNTAATTAAFVRGTNAAAADLQTALRTATGDSGLTVSGTTDEGPYTITFAETTVQPELTVTGTDCSGAVTVTTRGGGGPAS